MIKERESRWVVLEDVGDLQTLQIGQLSKSDLGLWSFHPDNTHRSYSAADLRRIADIIDKRNGLIATTSRDPDYRIPHNSDC